MEKFVPRFQGREWRDGMGVLHVYVLPCPDADDALLSLARACVPLMENHPIDPQLSGEGDDAGLLHLTVEMLADMPSAEYDQAARHVLVRALEEALADVAPFTTEAGPPIGNIAGAVLDVWPETEVLALTERVRSAIRKARGESALQYPGGRPHISLGYAYGTGSSDQLNSQLRNEITPRRAPLRIDRVHLLNVTWAKADDIDGWRMSWEPVAEIHLGGAGR
ncbi:2'-5' RNA ligase family protein [Streptomyces sp. NPDC093249]|uniref:2'-5' RNA ligase family protein n=1 Tax=unclassified Streptomyces TaxID=2593676 RepID=UPI00344C04E4